MHGAITQPLAEPGEPEHRIWPIPGGTQGWDFKYPQVDGPEDIALGVLRLTSIHHTRRGFMLTFSAGWVPDPVLRAFDLILFRPNVHQPYRRFRVTGVSITAHTGPRTLHTYHLAEYSDEGESTSR